MGLASPETFHGFGADLLREVLAAGTTLILHTCLFDGPPPRRRNSTHTAHKLRFRQPRAVIRRRPVTHAAGLALEGTGPRSAAGDDGPPVRD